MAGIYWLASYPKSGSTWFRIFLQNLRENSTVPADINRLDSGAVASARRWLDIVLGFDTTALDADELERLRPSVYRWWTDHEDTEFHKIHDAYYTLADGQPLVGEGTTLGAVYIVRNPLDVAPSYAHHNSTDLRQAIAHMADPGHVLSFDATGARNQTRQRLFNWSYHVLSWIEAPGLRCHVVRYEDMVERPLETFTEAARFLGFDVPSERIERAIAFSSFEELRRQENSNGFHERPPKVSSFFREGRMGAWRDTMSDECIAQIIASHGPMMLRFGYLDGQGRPA